MARTFVAANPDSIALDTSLDIGTIPNLSMSVWSNHTAGATHVSFLSAANDGNTGAVHWRISEGAGSAVQTVNKQAIIEVGSSTTAVTPAVWSHCGFSYDAVNWAFYLNGAGDGTGSNAQAFSAAAYRIGSGTNLNEPFNGALAEFAIWDALLTAAEWAALGRGYSPLLIRPHSLVEYVPMLREVVSIVRGVPTATGTTVSAHPRVIMPRRRRGGTIAFVTPPAPPETLFAQACL